MKGQMVNQPRARAKSALRDWIESIIIAFIMAMFIRTFFVQAFKIPTSSMRTTLLEGDVILVNKFIYGARVPLTNLSLPALRQPKKGDVIVFVYPNNPKKDFIKRLVAVSNETVEIKNGTVYVDGRALVDSGFSSRYYYNRGQYGESGVKITVPKDSLFVLGDNSANSEDSRYWGFVPRKNVIGKAILIYWPISRIRIIR